MILTRNVVTEDGQTIFSGEFVPKYPEPAKIQERMTWLHDYQIATRIEIELRNKPYMEHPIATQVNPR
jgi:hypothetical protein